jgi:urease accessory protein
MSWWLSFVHVIGEPSHVLAMLAIGTWAAMLGGRAAWLLPIISPLVTPFGAAIGAAVDVAPPWTEAGLAGSAVVLGLLLAGAVRPAVPVGVLVAGLFALAHGYEHGLAMPETANPPVYQLGLIAGAVVLQLFGFGLGRAARRLGRGELARRLGGAAVAFAGTALFVSAIRQG